MDQIFTLQDLAPADTYALWQMYIKYTHETITYLQFIEKFDRLVFKAPIPS